MNKNVNKPNIKALNAKHAKLQKELAEVKRQLKACGGNTYVIEYWEGMFDKRPRKVTVKALNANDAIEKWRADYHQYDCQGCAGDYPIEDVYLKGHKTPKGQKTYAQREKEAKHNETMQMIENIFGKHKLN